MVAARAQLKANRRTGVAPPNPRARKKRPPPPPPEPPETDTWSITNQELMRASCAYFASEVLRGPEQAPYFGKFLAAEHHELWDELVCTKYRLCILAPRDHGKTYFFDFAVPIWEAAFHPNGRGYIFSATQDQAIRILQDIKDEIEDNPKLAWLLPSPREQWSKTSIKLRNGHRIYARGYGTKIRGAHPDWIVVDDGLNDEDAYSEITRQKNIDYFYTAITNMIVPGGQIIVVGTPFHALDLYADLSGNPEYTFRAYPALDEKTGTALWAERYSVATLQRKRREIGSIRFTREFLCQPISDDMSLFPRKLFRGTPTEQFTVKLGMPAAYWDSIGVKKRFIGVDIAMSASTGADFFVIFVLGIDRFGNRWVVDIIRPMDPETKRPLALGYQQMLSLINAAGQKYDAELIYIEANQMQRVFGEELIRLSDLPIKPFVTSGTYKGKKKPKGNTATENKNSLEGGVPSLRVLLENGKFRIPRGDAHSVEVTDVWISEMQSFTWLEGKLQGVGAKDDTVMALWVADQAVRAGGFSFSTGEEEEDDDLTEEEAAKPRVKRALTVNELIAQDIGASEEEEAELSKARRKKNPDPVASAMERIFGDSGPEDEEDEGDDGTAVEDDEDTDKPKGIVAKLVDDDGDSPDYVRSAWASAPGLGRRGF